MDRFWVIGDSKKVLLVRFYFSIKLFLHTFCQKRIFCYLTTFLESLITHIDYTTIQRQMTIPRLTKWRQYRFWRIINVWPKVEFLPLHKFTIKIEKCSLMKFLLKSCTLKELFLQSDQVKKLYIVKSTTYLRELIFPLQKKMSGLTLTTNWKSETSDTIIWLQNNN